MESSDVRDFRCECLITEYMTKLAIKDMRQEHDHCSKLNLPREKSASPTHYANRNYSGAGIELSLYRIFFVSHL
jgi:hypothetical protein